MNSLAKCLLHRARHREFRNQLVKFIIKQWSTSEVDEIMEIIGEKRVFVSFGIHCHLFSKNYELGKTLSSFETNHPEVASKIIFHVNKIAARDILIRSSQCEKILVYLIYNMQFWPQEKKIWMEICDIKKTLWKR